jgi:hypothetical protein
MTGCSVFPLLITIASVTLGVLRFEVEPYQAHRLIKPFLILAQTENVFGAVKPLTALRASTQRFEVALPRQDLHPIHVDAQELGNVWIHTNRSVFGDVVPVVLFSSLHRKGTLNRNVVAATFFCQR